ncbi:MAG: tyrosine-type recombinase/integrase [Planctomycetota bacterium]
MSRVFQPSYTYVGPDGQRVGGKSKKWHIEYRDTQGRTVHRVAGSTEKQAREALKIAEARVWNNKNGVPTEGLNKTPCEDLRNRYLSQLHPRVSKCHYENVRRQIDKILKDAKAVYLVDLSPDALDEYKAHLATTGVAPRTINTHLSAVKAMFEWAKKTRVIPYNPLDCVSPLPETVKHRKRRPLTVDEQQRLLDVARSGPYRRAVRSYEGRARVAERYAKVLCPPVKFRKAKLHRLDYAGEQAVATYQMLLGTGLRVNELRLLLWSDLNLDQGLMHLRPETTKNRKAATVPLAPYLVTLLRAWRERSGGADRATVVAISSRLLENFYDDLEAAGIDREDASGRKLDLHCLRHTFAQRLNDAGIDPKTMQALLRHSSATLTLGVYIHKDKSKMVEAVASLQSLGTPPAAPRVAQDAPASRLA